MPRMLKIFNYFVVLVGGIIAFWLIFSLQKVMHEKQQVTVYSKDQVKDIFISSRTFEYWSADFKKPIPSTVIDSAVEGEGNMGRGSFYTVLKENAGEKFYYQVWKIDGTPETYAEWEQYFQIEELKDLIDGYRQRIFILGGIFLFIFLSESMIFLLTKWYSRHPLKKTCSLIPYGISCIYLIIIIVLTLEYIDIDYGWYLILRFLITGTAIYYATCLKEQKSVFWVFISIAILFNPVIKFSFSKEIWIVFDCIVLCFFSAVLFSKPPVVK